MDTFKAITATLLSLFSAIFLEYFLKFRPGLAEKFVLKADCQRTYDALHEDVKETYREISKKLDDITKTQTLILQELGKKVDRTGL